MNSYYLGKAFTCLLCFSVVFQSIVLCFDFTTGFEFFSLLSIAISAILVFFADSELSKKNAYIAIWLFVPTVVGLISLTFNVNDFVPAFMASITINIIGSIPAKILSTYLYGVPINSGRY